MTPKILLLFSASIAIPAGAQTLQGQALVTALQQGGYIIVMRHASSPREAPGKETANADNVRLERQLDEDGRATAAAMGKALRELKIPIDEVLTSPTYRALETVKYAQFGPPHPMAELGDNGQSMKGGTEAQAMWLRNRLKNFPHLANTIIVTHAPNLMQAFPKDAAGVADGEALIFGPDGKGGAKLVARVKIDEWPKLAAAK
ncbi:MAG: histidine phosphatase family protein [Bryobacterales bacterium]|nr:histidine phosphatase family protein [Bryobacterales bacterium]MBV9401401.1 histidine phosphatase family protein [Bryobacterales bacterium]